MNVHDEFVSAWSDVGRVLFGFVSVGLVVVGLSVATNVRGLAVWYSERFTRWRTRDNRIIFTIYAVVGCALLASSIR